MTQIDRGLDDFSGDPVKSIEADIRWRDKLNQVREAVIEAALEQLDDPEGVVARSYTIGEAEPYNKEEKTRRTQIGWSLIPRQDRGGGSNSLNLSAMVPDFVRYDQLGGIVPKIGDFVVSFSRGYWGPLVRIWVIRPGIFDE